MPSPDRQTDDRAGKLSQEDRIEAQERTIEQLREQLSEKDRQLEQARESVTEKVRQLSVKREQFAQLAGKPVDGVRPENVVWIFGFGRSGSTWLSSLLSDLEGHALWHEPLIGALFGNFYYNVSYYGIPVGDVLHDNPEFILGSERRVWLEEIRSFFLRGAGARHPALGDGVLVVKEPNGSVGAPLLMEALPESRMILLVRDPRDAMASALDAYSEGSWALKVLRKEGEVRGIAAEKWLEWYLQSMNNAKQAYENHEGRKVLVRYEDLHADALGTMKRVVSALSLSVEDGELAGVVDKHSWENISEEKKGKGKFYRKGTPGGWRDDLSAEQVELVERATAQLVREFYPSDSS